MKITREEAYEILEIEVSRGSSQQQSVHATTAVTAFQTPAASATCSALICPPAPPSPATADNRR